MLTKHGRASIVWTLLIVVTITAVAAGASLSDNLARWAAGPARTTAVTDGAVVLSIAWISGTDNVA